MIFLSIRFTSITTIEIHKTYICLISNSNQSKKIFRATISSIKYFKNTRKDTIALHVYNNSPDKIRLPLGVLGYCETKAPFYCTQERAYH